MAQICIWTNVETEYDYIKNICKDVDPDLTDDDFIGSSFTNNQGVPNYSQYEDEVGSGFRPIIIFPYSEPEINLVNICNQYPDYYFIQPLFNYGIAVPSAKVLNPDRPSPMIIGSGGEGGETGWMSGESLIFVESSFQYDSYDISEIVDNEDGTARIKCEGIGNLFWSFYVDSFELNIPVYIQGVTGFENNPDGVYYPVADSYYTDPTTNWVDITCNLGTGSYEGGAKAGFNFLSGAVAVIGAKLNKIRRVLNCTYAEAIAIAKATASNPERDDIHGYGSINVDDALSFDLATPADPDSEIGEIGTLTYERDNLGNTTLRLPELRNAQSIRLYRGNDLINEQEVDYGEAYDYTSALPAGTYRVIGYQQTSYSNSSNEITTNSMALTNRPFKSKYTIGDTVYYNGGGSITELTVTSVIVEVSDPNDDGVGQQNNKYGFSEVIQQIEESKLFSSKNSLIKNMKGNYLNRHITDGDVELTIPFAAINSLILSPLSFNDLAGYDWQAFPFNDPDQVYDPGGNPLDLTDSVIDNSDFTSAVFPAAADTVAELKALVKSYDKLSTIWTDGRPIIDWSGLTINENTYSMFGSGATVTAAAAANTVVVVAGIIDFTELTVGDYIRLGVEERIIATITDANNLTVTVNWGTTHTAVTCYHCSTLDLSSRDLSGLECVGTDFSRCKMPANADTKAEFKALVASYSSTSTIWIDGTPVGD